jgi:hypothetical protein
MPAIAIATTMNQLRRGDVDAGCDIGASTGAAERV